jgi:alkanesulfonate monooxygenase SsuD/methylene tetrahydromethanopterin reductase-like flavin-dependent oxidoreductase (luciferase family)
MLPAYGAGLRLAALAALAEGTGYDDFWLADERFFREVYACLTLCALRTHASASGPA